MMLFGNAIKNFYGTVALTTPGGGAVSVNSAGNVSIGAPASGTSLVVASSPGNFAAIFTGAASNPGLFGLQDGNAGSRVWQTRVGAVGVGIYDLYDNTAALSRFQISTTGNVAVLAPTNGTALSVTGVGNANAVLITGSATSGQSFGARILAGTTAADVSLEVSNKAGSVDFLALFGDGHGTIGPSGVLGLSWTAAGNVTISAPTSGTAFSVFGAAGNAIALIDGVGAASGVTWRRSGTSIGDEGSGDFIVSGGSLSDFGITSRAGALILGSNSTTRVTVANNGTVLIAAPSSGTPLTINRTGDGDSLVFGRSGSNFLDIGSGNAFLGGQAEIFTIGANPLGIGTTGSTTSSSLHFYVNNTLAATVNTGQQWLFPATTAGPSINVSGAANVFSAAINGSATSGQSFGLAVFAGTTASDIAFRINNQANTLNYFQVNGDGGTIVGAPTGGDQGFGTLNATGVFINGVDVRAAGSLTGTTLNATVVTSSLTAVGTLGSLAVTGAITSGSQVVGAATGGNQGAGTLNATGLFVNGVAVTAGGGATTGSFTAGTTGLSGATIACSWTKIGNTVIMRTAVPSSTTSTLTSFSITSLPAAIQPTTAKYAAGGNICINNGVSSAGSCSCLVNAGSTITLLFNGSGAGWTASGTKTLGDTVDGVTLVWDLS